MEKLNQLTTNKNIKLAVVNHALCETGTANRRWSGKVFQKLNAEKHQLIEATKRKNDPSL